MVPVISPHLNEHPLEDDSVDFGKIPLSGGMPAHSYDNLLPDISAHPDEHVLSDIPIQSEENMLTDLNIRMNSENMSVNSHIHLTTMPITDRGTVLNVLFRSNRFDSEQSYKNLIRMCVVF